MTNSCLKLQNLVINKYKSHPFPRGVGRNNWKHLLLYPHSSIRIFLRVLLLFSIYLKCKIKANWRVSWCHLSNILTQHSSMPGAGAGTATTACPATGALGVWAWTRTGARAAAAVRPPARAGTGPGATTWTRPWLAKRITMTQHISNCEH